MTEQRSGYYRREDSAGISDLMGSFMRMATASTRFSIDQMFNAMSMFTDPRGAMNRVKHSMDNLSGAMQGSERGGSHSSTSTSNCGASASRSMTEEEELTGRKS